MATPTTCWHHICYQYFVYHNTRGIRMKLHEIFPNTSFFSSCQNHTGSGVVHVFEYIFFSSVSVTFFCHFLKIYLWNIFIQSCIRLFMSDEICCLMDGIISNTITVSTRWVFFTGRQEAVDYLI